MAFAALVYYYYYAKKPILSMTNTPANVNPLVRYIKEQLYDILRLKLGSITNMINHLNLLYGLK